MANQEHLDILKQGVEVWNQWRKEYPDIQPNLVGADLSGADLRKADLSEANFTKADLSGADLCDVRFHNDTISGGFLTGTDLTSLEQTSPMSISLEQTSVMPTLTTLASLRKLSRMLPLQVPP